jgi:hypothetical protein
MIFVETFNFIMSDPLTTFVRPSQSVHPHLIKAKLYFRDSIEQQGNPGQASREVARNFFLIPPAPPANLELSS